MSPSKKRRAPFVPFALAVVGCAPLWLPLRASFGESPTVPTSRPALRAEGASVDVAVDALAAQLSAAGWKDRQQAQDALVRYGDDARPRIEKLLRDARDPETVNRLRGILLLVGENHFIGPSRVTLHLKGVPAEKAFAALSRAASVALPAEPAELWTSRQWPAVTLDAEREPFWKVLRDLCRQTGIEPTQGNESNAAAAPSLTLTEGTGKWGRYPAVVDGPVMIVAQSATLTRTVEFEEPGDAPAAAGKGDVKPADPLAAKGLPGGVRAAGDTDQSLGLSLQVLLEPKMRVLSGMSAAWLDEATDDRGRSLVNDENDGAIENTPGENAHNWALNLDLTAAEPESRKIVKLQGKVRLVVPTRWVRAEIADPMNVVKGGDATRTLEGKRWVLEEASQPSKGVCEIKLTLHRGGLAQAEWNALVQGNPVENVRLFDERGTGLTPTVTNTESVNDQKVSFTLNFDGSTPQGGDDVAAPANANPAVNAPIKHAPNEPVPWGKPAKLLLEMPAETKELFIPFTFNNLPLRR